MKRKALEGVRSKDLATLKKDLAEARLQLVKLRLEKALRKIKNVRVAKNKKRDIAQLLTIIKEKEEQVKK